MNIIPVGTQSYSYASKGDIMKRLILSNTKSCRIAKVNEFDNGRVFHNWDKISSDRAEALAAQASIDDPNNIYYVAYDDVMNPSSDIFWVKGESFDNYSEALEAIRR